MVLSVLILTSAQSCAIENAHYALRTQPSVTASFIEVNSGKDWPSNLAMRLDVAESDRTYWWLPWNGGSNGQQNLASTHDPRKSDWRPPGSDGGPRPLGDLQFIATDSNYALWDHVPVRGESAPAHFIIPDLRDALWYRTPATLRDRTVRQFFDLIRCDGRSK